MQENVNHPSHYTQGNVECIECLKSATVNKPPFEAVCVANAIKYLWRYEEKGGIEDVDKALWYINRLRKELIDKSNQYTLISTENGVGLMSPWHTTMVPKEGDMFNPNDSAREHLLDALLNGGGYCPCQPKKDRDTMCPCKHYRVDGKCVCGLYIKIPQMVVNSEDDKDKVVGNDPDTEKGTE